MSISASFHARFLRNLVIEDINKQRRPEPERTEESMPIDPRLQGKLTVFATGGYLSNHFAYLWPSFKLLRRQSK